MLCCSVLYVIMDREPLKVPIFAALLEAAAAANMCIYIYIYI